MKSALTVLLLSTALWGQVYSSGGPVVNNVGQPVAAQIAVCTTQPPLPNPPTTNPPNCSAYAPTYSDATLATPCSLNPSTLGPLSGVSCTNPGKTDSRGNYTVYAASTVYYAEIYGYGIQTYLMPFSIASTAAGNFASPPPIGNVTPNTGQFTKMLSTLSPWADVKAYGALGDGVTHDDAAFQAAINAVCSAGGGTVFVPASPTPYLVAGVTIPSSCINDSSGFSKGIRIVGAGKNYTVLYNYSTSTDTIDAICASGVSCWHLEMESLSLQVSSNFNGWQLSTQNVSDLHLKDVWIDGGDSNSAHTCGIYLKGRVGVIFTWNIQIDEISGSGCSLYLDSVDDSTVTGGYIYPFVTGGGRPYAIKLNNPQNVRISGMHDIGNPAIGSCASVYVTGTALSLSIENNFFDAPGTLSPTNACYGLYFAGDSAQPQIQNNTFGGVLNSAIYFASTTEQPLIEGNSFVGSSYNLSNVGATAVVGFIGISSGGVISGNTMSLSSTLGTGDWNFYEQVASTNQYSNNTWTGAGFLTNPWLIASTSRTTPVVAAPTVGQAACIYAAGPPVQIGKCTTVVSSGGACTCAP